MNENIIERLSRTRATLTELCSCDHNGFCGACIGKADIDYIADKVERLRDGLSAVLQSAEGRLRI